MTQERIRVTMLDKRIGKALAAAVYATSRLLSITEVAMRAAELGLEPRDFDNSNGTDALIAIAQSMRPLALVGLKRREPPSWRGAVHAALKVVTTRETDRQRRAERRRAELKTRDWLLLQR